MPKHSSGLIDPFIQRNAHFLHPEYMLLNMAINKPIYVRERTFRRWFKPRNQTSKYETVLSFLLSDINFKISDYAMLIGLSLCQLSPPPIMDHVTIESIFSFLHRKVIPEFNYINTM